MRHWIGIILIVFGGVAGAETEHQAALVHIGPDDFTTKTLGRETVEGHVYLIVQAEARNRRIANSLGYCSIRAWYDMHERVTRKVLLLDQDDVILTTIQFYDFTFTDGTPRAGRMQVTDHANGQITVFQLDAYTNPINPLTLI